jgi:UDP-3-O-[3-hydroxymyristoyl] glucosamine N-acyltransferase
MSVTVRELAEAAGMAFRIIGDAGCVVDRASGIAEAGADAVTFCSRPDVAMIAATKANVVVCSEAVDTAKTLIVVAEPRLAFLRIIARHFPTPRPAAGVHATAVIAQGVELGEDISIGAHVVVGGNCRIGARTVIHPNVVLYANTIVGEDVTIHAGTVIGADGYGYQRNERGELEKFPHIGGVVIENGVEIGSNTSIDRGTLGATLIREGARIDNLVHIAHNVVVGRNAAVIANAIIGGSTKIGDGAWIAPSACLREGLTIGANAVVGLGAVVTKNVADDVTVMGAPARPADEYKRFLAAAAKLMEDP